MPDHRNIFEPYDRKLPSHEDALTRAFAIVLRAVPVAHAAWLALVDRGHRANRGAGVPFLHELPAPEVHMQTSQVPRDVVRVVSVVQTDEWVFTEADALPSERRQVLDVVITYDDLAIVVENKPSHKDIWEGQLDVNVPSPAAHDPRVGTVTWSSIVEAWGRVLEAGNLAPAESVLVGDFLDFVEEHFPRLRPYSRVGQCGHDRDRLARRCRALLKDLAPEAARFQQAWGDFVLLPAGQCAKMIGLFPRRGEQEPDLVVEIDPGDNMSQARLLYEKGDLEPLLRLREQGWRVEPNLHLSHVTKNLVHTTSSIDLTAFWAIWSAGSPWFRTWERHEFDSLVDLLFREGLASESDRAAIERHITATQRTYVRVVPGLHMQWRWSVSEAAGFDRRGHLEESVRQRMLEGASALGLRTPVDAVGGR